MILALLVAVAAARPDYGSRSDEDGATILRNEVDIQDDGTYRADMETSNGIAMSHAGEPSGPKGAVASAGTFSWVFHRCHYRWILSYISLSIKNECVSNIILTLISHYSWTAPDGTPVEVRYVADENGYQPDSDVLPVAPEFPHPIPDFVLLQIEKARREDSGRSSEEYRPPKSYRAP